MQSFTVVLDACVLVPITTTDTLLRLAQRELYRPIWSDRIIAEAERAVIKIHSDIDPARIAHRFAKMNDAFEDACIAGWEQLETSIILPDPNDRHVVACALVAGADAIVTQNIPDFPSETLDPLGIEILDPDDFLLDLLDLAPEAVVSIIREQVEDAHHPPLTIAKLIANLAASGTPNFAGELARLM